MSQFTFDNTAVEFEPGQTVGAALTNAGIRSWRTTRSTGKPRGLFCCIGVCFDCLIVVNGTPNTRACLIEAAEGMTVAAQHGTGWA